MAGLRQEPLTASSGDGFLSDPERTMPPIGETGEESAVICRAAAALPHRDRARAVDGLRRQLWVMAVAADAAPDWTTLTVTGPTEVPGTEPATRFEWRASVALLGATIFDARPARDDPWGDLLTPDDTAPLPAVHPLGRGLRPADVSREW